MDVFQGSIFINWYAFDKPNMETDLISKVGVALGIAATAASAAVASNAAKKLISKFVERSTEITLGGVTVSLEAQTRSRPRVETAKRQVLLRLDEARRLQVKKQSSATASTWSARSLTFGQYVIGGVLASSFVQQKTTPQIIGVFGVLVSRIPDHTALPPGSQCPGRFTEGRTIAGIDTRKRRPDGGHRCY
jgi:hypothetical protein